MAYKLIVTQKAEADLDAIIGYISGISVGCRITRTSCRDKR